jgi:alcohol/geraniol dehydrogenase (NADP+)
MAGGMPGSPAETGQVIAFAARHSIKPMVRTFPMSDTDGALDHVRQGRARFQVGLAA